MSDLAEETHNFINTINKLEADRDRLLQLLATERDAFGKKETELKAELEKLKEDHKWLRRNYEEEKMLVSDYTKLQSQLASAVGTGNKLYNDLINTASARYSPVAEHLSAWRKLGEGTEGK